jgi:hypothetical protein
MKSISERSTIGLGLVTGVGFAVISAAAGYGGTRVAITQKVSAEQARQIARDEAQRVMTQSDRQFATREEVAALRANIEMVGKRMEGVENALLKVASEMSHLNNRMQ